LFGGDAGAEFVDGLAVVDDNLGGGSVT